MTDEDKKNITAVAEQLEKAVQEDQAAKQPVTSTFSVAVWAARRLRHLAR